MRSQFTRSFGRAARSLITYRGHSRTLCTKTSPPSVSEANRARIRDYLSRFGNPTVTPDTQSNSAIPQPPPPLTPTQESVPLSSLQPNPNGSTSQSTTTFTPASLSLPHVLEQTSEKEIKKAIPLTTGSLPSTNELQEIMESLGAKDVCALDVRKIAPFANWLIVGTARAGPHVRAVAQGICDDLRERKVRVGGQLPAVLDKASSEWQVVDVGATVVHVLSSEAREIYQLERLWSPEGESHEGEEDLACEVIHFDDAGEHKRVGNDIGVSVQSDVNVAKEDIVDENIANNK